MDHESEAVWKGQGCRPQTSRTLPTHTPLASYGRAKPQPLTTSRRKTPNTTPARLAFGELRGAARWAQFPAIILSKVFICQGISQMQLEKTFANNDHRLGWDGRPGYALRSCGVRFFHFFDLPSSSLLSDYQAFVLPNLPS